MLGWLRKLMGIPDFSGDIADGDWTPPPMRTLGHGGDWERWGRASGQSVEPTRRPASTPPPLPKDVVEQRNPASVSPNTEPGVSYLAYLTPQERSILQSQQQRSSSTNEAPQTTEAPSEECAGFLEAAPTSRHALSEVLEACGEHLTEEEILILSSQLSPRTAV